VDHEHVIIEMKSLNRTNKRAISVTTINARLGHDIGHLNSLLLDGKVWRNFHANLNQKCGAETTMLLKLGDSQ